MKKEDVPQWLEKESKAGNQLAEMYSALLKDAMPEVRDYWHEHLANILEAAEAISREIREEARRSKG